MGVKAKTVAKALAGEKAKMLGDLGVAGVKEMAGVAKTAGVAKMRGDHTAVKVGEVAGMEKARTVGVDGVAVGVAKAKEGKDAWDGKGKEGKGVDAWGGK